MAERDLEKEMRVPEMLADHQREVDELYRASREHHCPRWPEKCTGSPDCPLCGRAAMPPQDCDAQAAQGGVGAVTAYYNEFDPKAAAWLRELIGAGLIAPGEVDERSILEVQPDDLCGFTQCHFFAGIGGWSYALRLAGWGDHVPVWTGSPPCQPFSVSGKGLGPDDERHLAPHFIKLVGACRPRVLFGEQVASAAVLGKASRSPKRGAGTSPEWAWFDDLSDRLEAARYSVGAADIPAAGVGAPNIRQRTFFGAIDLGFASGWLADINGISCDKRGEERGGRADRGAEKSRPGLGGIGCAGGLGHGVSAGLERHGGHVRDGSEPGRIDAKPDGSIGEASAAQRVEDTSSGHASSEREQCSGEYGFQPVSGGGAAGLASAHGRERGWRPEHEGNDAHGKAKRRNERNCQPLGNIAACGMDNTISAGLERHGGHDGPVGNDVDASRFDNAGEAQDFWSDADWLLCRDGKWRPVEPGTFPLAHGVSGRVGLLRGYGNAINPWAAKIFVEVFAEVAL